MLQALLDRLSHATGNVTAPRTIVLTSGGQTHTFSLDNAWLECIQAPDKKKEIFLRFVDSFAKCVLDGSTPEVISADKVVPIIKSRGCVESIPFGADPFIHEPLATHLVVVYAIDTERGIVWLRESNLKELNLIASDLRNLAVNNLRRILPEVRRVGDGGIYGLVAGGNYESSLLLFDRFWDDQAKDVSGDLVAAVPCRDLIFYTGSGSPQLLQMMTGIVNRMYEEGSYKISPSLLVRRSGNWVGLKNGANES